MSPTQYSDGTWIYCSGTLISSTAFLTAAHCGDTGETVGVTFDSAYVAGDKVYYGTFYADPAYNQTQSDPHDIAVVVFDKPIKGIQPAELPTLNSLSNLSGSQTFTLVGYGAYEVTNQPGGHQYLYNDVRMKSTGTLNSINKSWLRISPLDQRRVPPRQGVSARVPRSIRNAHLGDTAGTSPPPVMYAECA
ncbi:MAG: trypsin-like serine protease [Candidatus Limnocylindrales bacterium]